MPKSNYRNFNLIVWLAISIILFISGNCMAQWQYDWSARTDQYDNPAGILTNTPFPIDESMSSYFIENDEGVKTFFLGDKYFVDNSASGCSNGANNYDPALRSCGSGSNLVYSSIGNAISSISAGNKTILVRSGTYIESSLNMKAGSDDTHRWMITGYKQERPVVDGNNNSSNVFESPNITNSYVTLQRLKVQNSRRRGFFAGNWGSPTNNTDGYCNIIDVHFSNLGMEAVGGQDGMLHFNNSHHNWVYHVTLERTYGHCIKVADDTTDTTVEWSIARECGYWSGIPQTNFWSHAAGFDFPNSGESGTAKGENHILRYNIVYNVLMQGIQFREASNFIVHHNEVYNTQRCWDIMTDKENSCDQRGYGNVQVLFYAEGTNEVSGIFSSNVIRNSTLTSGPADSQRAHLALYGASSNNQVVDIYNNTFYDHPDQAIYISSNNSGATVTISNNSFYVSNSDTIIDNDLGSSTVMENNILYQAGTGSCVQGSPNRAYNRYYFPNGDRGITLATGEEDGDPNWKALPGNNFSIITFQLSQPIAGTDLSHKYYIDFNSRIRAQWNMGAYEYIVTGKTPKKPANLQSQ